MSSRVIGVVGGLRSIPSFGLVGRMSGVGFGADVCVGAEVF